MGFMQYQVSYAVHICRINHLLQGSIDTGMDEGFGFPTSRTSSCGRHAWNLKILSNNPGSVLRCLGPVVGVTVPTLHVGMVFTTGCWYRSVVILLRLSCIWK